jgi:membrane-bound metal-dependent hydrolase YbcI (DUF457 family)
MWNEILCYDFGMTWRTHMVIGANAIWLAPFLGQVDQSLLVLLPVAMVASILPDIDASSAKIHYIAGGALGLMRGGFRGKYFHHRGVMHSILVAIIFFIILEIFFKDTYPLLAGIFAISYFSHSLIDGFNTGVGFFYPFYLKKFALVPKFLRTPVKGAADNFLFILGAFGLVMFFYIFKWQLFPL